MRLVVAVRSYIALSVAIAIEEVIDGKSGYTGCLAVSIHAPRVGCDCDAQRYALVED